MKAKVRYWLCAKCQERYRMRDSKFCVWCALVVEDQP